MSRLPTPKQIELISSLATPTIHAIVQFYAVITSNEQIVFVANITTIRGGDSIDEFIETHFCQMLTKEQYASETAYGTKLPNSILDSILHRLHTHHILKQCRQSLQFAKKAHPVDMNTTCEAIHHVTPMNKYMINLDTSSEYDHHLFDTLTVIQPIKILDDDEFAITAYEMNATRTSTEARPDAILPPEYVGVLDYAIEAACVIRISHPRRQDICFSCDKSTADSLYKQTNIEAIIALLQLSDNYHLGKQYSLASMLAKSVAQKYQLMPPEIMQNVGMGSSNRQSIKDLDRKSATIKPKPAIMATSAHRITTTLPAPTPKPDISVIRPISLDFTRLA